MTAHEQTTAPEERRSLMVLGDEIIANLKSPPSFWEAFERVKLDTHDSGRWDAERVVIIVAKGKHADRLAEAYDRG